MGEFKIIDHYCLVYIMLQNEKKSIYLMRNGVESEQANGSTIVNATTQHDKIPQTDPEQADEPSDCKLGKTSSSGQDTSINAAKHHWIHVSYFYRRNTD